MGPRGGLVFRLLWGLLILIGVGRWFKEPSDNHDARYFAGGTEEDRDDIDRDFLNEMLDVVDMALGQESLRGRYARWFAFKAYVAVNELSDDIGAFSFRPKPLTRSEIIARVRSS